jgi:hypothetical protein
MLQLADRISIGRSITSARVTLHPIYIHQEPADAIGAVRAGVRLSERPDPAVPEVQVINPADRPALLVAGTILRGGMQTRMVAGSALLPTNQPVALPVSCVEQGRWGGGAGFELTDSVAPRRVRRTTDVTMTRNLLAGRREADQSAVWASVEHELREVRAANPTRNLDARPEDRRAEAIQAMTDLGPLPGQTGVLVSHGERMVGADLFGNPDLLAEMWAGLIRSYYANAPERIYGRASSTWALTFLNFFLTRPTERTNGVALGQEHRVTRGGVTGTGLMAEDRLIHATCFARAA